MKHAQKHFIILVNKAYQPTLYANPQYALKKAADKPELQIFKFTSQQQANLFQKSLQANQTEDNLKVLIDQYKIDQQLEPYRQRLDAILSRRKNSDEGVSIDLNIAREYYVLDTGIGKPQLYFNRNIVEKYKTNNAQISYFENPEQALEYISYLITKQMKKEQQTQPDQISSEAILQQLQNLDLKYRALNNWYYDKQSIQVESGMYHMYCSEISLFNRHSAIGSIITEADTNKHIKTLACYSGQQLANQLSYISILYGIRCCIMSNIRQLICSVSAKNAFDTIQGQLKPKSTKLQIHVDAIKEYSSLIDVKFNLVPDEDTNEAKYSAQKALNFYLVRAKQSKLTKKV